ncbi:hypothetical protein CEXT_428581 [Caerostris extrusa]|uniref:Uncharacterized protein n=1 Tax=Caerostris extrusa TaxID=172846 RepID=A0AAV4R5B2_CAEEX|nr:hypothetical protein CEXT_428581 [Caerostris extrusa]
MHKHELPYCFLLSVREDPVSKPHQNLFLKLTADRLTWETYPELHTLERKIDCLNGNGIFHPIGFNSNRAAERIGIQLLIANKTSRCSRGGTFAIQFNVPASS